MVIIGLLSGFAALSACAEPPGKDTVGSSPGSGSVNGEEEREPESTEREGYLLTVDGNPIAYIENESDIKALTEHLIAEHKKYLSENGKSFDSVEIKSSFDLMLTKCKSEDVTDADGALQRLGASGVRITYAVTAKETVPIAFETVYKNSASYYEGTRKVQTAGKKGEKQRTYTVTYTGTEESSRELTEEKTLTAPTNEVILVGTKKSTASTGSYAWPTKSVYITSYYGWRTINGVRGYHYGIDLRAAVGTSIYASDGGKVIFVGTASGYGKLIKIQHDNGDVTYYAHLSSYSVKKGDRVYKGQLIAKSGATGRVTGPHLHFEIRKNGVQVNPIKHLPKL